MTALVATVFVVLATSALCSLCEAVLYSTPLSHVEALLQRGSRAGQVLHRLRQNVDEPITAILSLNTISNTAGAAIAGALAAQAFGDRWLVAFSAAFTVAILVFSEIVPKTAGVVYARPLSALIAIPLRTLVAAFRPVIWLSSLVTGIITGGRTADATSPEEIVVMARLGTRMGVINPDEALVIQNILSLKNKRVRDVLTPRTVLYALQGETSIGEAASDPGLLYHSRIPVYFDDLDDVAGIVHRSEVLAAAAEDKDAMQVQKLMKPVHFVPETIALDTVLERFLERGQHMFAVVDEFGGLAGVITLEDVLEEILGKEIVDEFDRATDMRELARRRREETAHGGA